MTEPHHVYFLLDCKGTVHDVFARAKAETTDVPSGYVLKQYGGEYEEGRALVLADTIRTRIRSSYVAPSWETFKKTLPQSAPQDFTAGYFGTRAIDALKEVRPYIDACETFADLTAGGGRFPYAL